MNKISVTTFVIVIFLAGVGWILLQNQNGKEISQSPQPPMGRAVTPPSSIPVPRTPPAPVPSRYTFSEVSKHADAQSCWTVIGANVYDLTAWINEHPGGPENILSICGADGTAAFEGQHGGQRKPERILENYILGPLTP